MSELWVLLEVAPLVALALLVGTAVLAHQKEDYEPEWWPDFEREFGLYVALLAPERVEPTRIEPERRGAAPSSPDRRAAHDRRAAND